METKKPIGKHFFFYLDMLLFDFWFAGEGKRNNRASRTEPIIVGQNFWWGTVVNVKILRRGKQKY